MPNFSLHLTVQNEKGEKVWVSNCPFHPDAGDGLLGAFEQLRKDMIQHMLSKTITQAKTW